MMNIKTKKINRLQLENILFVGTVFAPKLLYFYCNVGPRPDDQDFAAPLGVATDKWKNTVLDKGQSRKKVINCTFIWAWLLFFSGSDLCCPYMLFISDGRIQFLFRYVGVANNGFAFKNILLCH